MLQFISNSDHFGEVLGRVQSVKHSLWIGTADIKDLYVEVGKEKKPFLAVIALLIRKGVEVRLIHAKEPGPNFREDFDRYPVLYDRLERVLCPRVHFKMLVFDCEEVYIGSANLTGAGIGMKSSDKRNFETGILTDDPQIVEQAMKQFDDVWMGKRTSAQIPSYKFFQENNLQDAPLPQNGRGCLFLCIVIIINSLKTRLWQRQLMMNSCCR